MIRRFLAVALLAASPTFAQSTAGLRRAERPISVQLAAGGGASVFGESYGDAVGPLQAANIAVLGRTQGGMAVRGDAWALRKHAVTVRRFRTGSADSITTTLDETTLAVAIGLGGAFRLDLPYDFSIEALATAGIVPYARGTSSYREEPPQGAPIRETRALSGRGWYLSPGLSLRWKHVFVQQHALQVMGADGAVFNGEYAPLTFGLRW